MPTESKHLMLYLEGRDDMHVVKNLGTYPLTASQS